jgi:glycosyltransferase involved in cell wall biosynthesis
VTRPAVVAIIAAYNEADIIGHVVRDLVEQGIAVWFIDHASTDGTVAAVEPWLGRGVLHIERFPADGSTSAGRFSLASLLRRKEALATELDADWFINGDADEFRESPWARVTLREGIERVDAAGYNAIDFALFDFRPVDDGFRPGDDVREALRYYEPGQSCDRVQIRCWKKPDGPVDLASSGGHDVAFPGRKVFPIRFVLRHYPIRSQAHGERKVFVERRPRFVPEERDLGWHVQYDRFREGASFLGDPSTLAAWDPEAVRIELSLRHRGVEALEAEQAELRRAFEQERTERREQIEHLRTSLEAVRREMGTIYASRSWRWTAPLRAVYRMLTGRRV